jgi:glycogen debranching enzyme
MPGSEGSATHSRPIRRRYFRAELGHCLDVVDGPGGDDPSLRPNQLFAVSLEPDLLAPDQALAVVAAATTSLWIGLGLRSLAPGDPAYVGTYGGDRLTRDAAYHQGTGWTWLAGVYADALLRTGTSTADVREHLEEFMGHLRDAGLGTISECIEGNPPYRPVGCYAQAWSVGEVLRAFRRAT